MRIRFASLLLLLLLSANAFALPAHFTEKADAVPNICQSCFSKIVKWGGNPHCAPAAISNSLAWLAKNGIPALQPFQGADPDADQARLMAELGKYMGTSEHGGTSPHQVFLGLKKFLEEKNVTYRRFAAVGWRSVPKFVEVDGKSANLDWIKEGTLGNNSVWLLIGWYKYDAAKDNYAIYDGHWMTVVGYGKNRAGELDPNILIVHDPAERSERKNYYASISSLERGTIDGSRPPPGAAGGRGEGVRT